MANLDGIVKVYEDAVKEKDKKGYADLFKKAAKILFKNIEKELDFKVLKPVFLDGYFIFGTGTNSVVHFYIDKIPGWKFGIWWKEPNAEENPNDSIIGVQGEFFCQFEETIDKFKPSASSITSTIYVYLKDNSLDWELKRILEFINKEPELAFCRDYRFWDEWEYHTRQEAKKEFAKYKKHKEIEDKYREYFNTKYKIFIKEKVVKYFGPGTKIVDRGDCWSPRYQLETKSPGKIFDVEESGFYPIFDENYMDGELLSIKKQWEAIDKEKDKIEEKYQLFLHRDFDRDIYVRVKEKNKE